ncbi:MAG: hypothetical protein NXH89_00605 [Cyclobacteriaceae bacterium]|nr:hypothetical protein [Cyclobacteriaceae bacterium]
MILENENISRLELGSDKFLNLKICSLVEQTETTLKKVRENWKTLFSSDFGLDQFHQLTTNFEKDLQILFISKNEFDKKLPFVKSEKLLEIVEFPDFSELVSNLERLSSFLSNEILNQIGIEGIFSKSAKRLIEENSKKLASICEIVLTKRESIEKLLYLNLYLIAGSKLKRFFDNSDFIKLNETLKSQRIVTDNEPLQPFRLNKESYFKKRS